MLTTNEELLPSFLKKSLRRNHTRLKRLPSNYRNTRFERVSAYKVPLSDFLHVKNVLKQVPSIHQLLPTVQAFIGLARVKQFSASTKVAKNIDKQLKEDPAVASYLTIDLEHIGQMDKQDLQEMGNRLLKNVIPNIFAGSASREFANEYLRKLQHQLETYAKFARASFFRKKGPKHNPVTNEIATTMSMETLHEMIHLALLSALALDESEINKIRALRESLTLPNIGFKVLSESDYQNYKQGSFDSIIGFWGDARLYQKRSRDDIIYDFLRLDYPETEHNVSNQEITYAIQFDTSDLEDQLKEQIPFAFELMKPSLGYDPDNLPSNPFTGTGFTAARKGEFVPEFQATWEQRILLKKGAKLGYFDKAGEFHPEYIYSGKTWQSAERENGNKPTMQIPAPSNLQKSIAAFRRQRHPIDPTPWDLPDVLMLNPERSDQDRFHPRAPQDQMEHVK